MTARKTDTAGAQRSPPRLVLASGSPRRRALLDLIGLTHVVRPSGIEEVPADHEIGVSFAERAARDKAVEVAAHASDLPVLGADTVVELEGRILGKPVSAADARSMLEQLSGKVHRVHTAMALVIDGRCESLVETAEVRFHPLEGDQIQWYIGTGEPLDKAGAYAIQGIGGLFVASITGSPHTVVGLPIHRLHELFLRHRRSMWRLLRPSTG